MTVVGIITGSEEEVAVAGFLRPLIGEATLIIMGPGRDPQIAAGTCADGSRGGPLRLFPQDPQTNRLLGVEATARSCDLLVCLEGTRLSALDALALAKEQRKPLAVLVSERVPALEDYRSLAALRQDVWAYASAFLAVGAGVAETLAAEGIPEGRIFPLQPTIDGAQFFRSPAQRLEWRGQFGFAVSDRVALFHGRLEPETHPERVIAAAHRLFQQEPQAAERLRILVAGEGSLADTLKHQAYDSGFGQRFCFLQQPIEPLACGIYNMVDAVFQPRLSAGHFEPYPWHLFRAAACGAKPLIACGQHGAPELKGIARVIAGDEPSGWVEALHEVAREPLAHAPWRSEMAAMAGNRDQLAGLIAAVPRCDFAQFRSDLGGVEAALASGRNEDAVERCQGILKTYPLPDPERSDVLCLSGQAWLAQGKLDRAFEDLGEAVAVCEQNHRAFRELGFLSIHSQSWEEASVFLKRALALHLNDGRTLYGLGLLHIHQENFSQGIYFLEKSLMFHRERNPALALMIQVCHEEIEPWCAVKLMERVRHVIGDEPGLMLGLGKSYLRAGDAEKGQELLRRYLGSTPE